MRLLAQKTLILSLLLTILMGWALPAALADEDLTAEPVEEEEVVEEIIAPTPIVSDAVRNAYLMIRLNQYLQQAERNYKSLQSKMDQTRDGIEENRYTIDTLDGQIFHLDALIDTTDSKIISVTTQIAEKEQEIKDSLEALEFSEVQINGQKDALSSYLRLIYFETNLNSSQNMETNFLKLFMRDGTISTSLQTSSFLSILEKQAENLIDGLENLEREQLKTNYNLTLKQNQLDDLEEELEAEYRNLTAQLEGKQNLLHETEDHDEIYRELYASYKAAQEAILDEINLFQTNILALEDRLAQYSGTITEEEIALIDQIKNDSDVGFATAAAANFLDLDWPVSPSLGLTAFFDDEDYVSRFGVAHHATDVRIAHGSIIYAPADGMVYKVYDAAKLSDETERLGYGYIILAHRMGTMTLYGHISSALVSEGDFVNRGQMIGLTGGTPGTPGAGARTTGAHLHFEVIQDAVRVDPLEYLPLAEVPTESLPDTYTPMLEEQLREELRELQEAQENEEATAEEEAPWSQYDETELIQETIENNFVIDSLDDDAQEDFWTHGANN